jgi:hypothetical protein
MSPWRWTQIKGSKHVGQWNCTINVIELYILSDCEYIYTQLVFPDILKQCSDFIFKGWEVQHDSPTLEDESPTVLQNVRKHWVMLNHIPEGMNPQENCYGNLKSCKSAKKLYW